MKLPSYKSILKSLWGDDELKESTTSTPYDLVKTPPTASPLNPIVKQGSPIPNSRQSKPSGTGFDMGRMVKGFNELETLQVEWYLAVIPIIRKLVQTNPDLGQALKNVLTLGNTGHKVFFDSTVDPKIVDKMRRHLDTKHKEWAPFVPGVDGLVNQIMSQAIIGGATSIEWVPDPSLRTIEAVVFVNPEEVRFKPNPRGTGYEVFQKPKNYIGKNADGLIKLNQLTYKYYSMNGDGSSPYGCPEYLTTLRGIKSQTSMLDNIDFIIEQLGVMGFVELMIDKPEMQDEESEAKYFQRLENRLELAKTRASGGFKDGVIVGYKDDHEINFNPISRDFDGVNKVFEQNELQIASGTKQDASLWGRGYSSSESQITIIFTKLLSELKSIQKVAAHNLEYGYKLELLLQGYKVDYLKVKFNPSTLQDELKYQQGLEIKIRNFESLMIDGLIDQNTFADAFDIDKPHLEGPLVPYQDRKGSGTSQVQKDKNLKDKNKSERKKTDKENPQGTVKKQKL